jgi:hypothetical protein
MNRLFCCTETLRTCEYTKTSRPQYSVGTWGLHNDCLREWKKWNSANAQLVYLLCLSLASVISRQMKHKDIGKKKTKFNAMEWKRLAFHLCWKASTEWPPLKTATILPL